MKSPTSTIWSPYDGINTVPSYRVERAVFLQVDGALSKGLSCRDASATSVFRPTRTDSGSRTGDVLPCLGMVEGQLVRRNAHDWSIFLMEFHEPVGIGAFDHIICVL